MRHRNLSGESIKYLINKEVNFKMRITDNVELIPVLVVMAVKEGGQELVLGFQAGDRESAFCYRDFFRDLRHLCFLRGAGSARSHGWSSGFRSIV